MRVLRRGALYAGIALLAGCASVSVEELHPLGVSTEPRPRSEVRFYPSADQIPFAFKEIAIFTPRRLRAFNESALEPYLVQSALRGGNALFIDTTGKRPLIVAAYVDTTSRTALARPAVARSGGAAVGTGDSGGCRSACTVHVRGYTRKDGTYVRPHTRSAPGSGRGRRP